MKTVSEEGVVTVAPSEAFRIARRGAEGSGYRTRIETPDGVAHLGTQRDDPAAFGGTSRVYESFKCSRPGTFRIVFTTGRPWQPAATTTTTTTVHCRQ